MDIYAPSDPGEYPVVIAFHGGSTVQKSFRSLGVALADNGIVTFAVGWHSAPPPADDFLWGWEDAACAVRWVRKNAAAYGGNPSRIIVVGHSAGGAAGAVVTLGGDDFQNHCLGGENISALADGFVGLDGAYHILNYIPDETKSKVPEEIERLIDPFYQVNTQPFRKDVKFILLVSNHEVLRISAEDFHSVLQSAGYPSELIMFDDINHNGIVGGSNEEIVNAIVELAYDW
jgi:acetyl esterase/lipase